MSEGIQAKATSGKREGERKRKGELIIEHCASKSANMTGHSKTINSIKVINRHSERQRAQQGTGRTTGTAGSDGGNGRNG